MQLTNVVVQANLGCSFDLRELAYRLPNVRYDPRTFSALIWQHRKIGGNCLLFSNGIINCNGKCLSIQDGRRRLRRYARLLQQMGNDVRLTQVRILTASASHQLSGRVDPYRLPSEFSFEPEIFPAVMFRRHGMHFTCHLSGGISRPLGDGTIPIRVLDDRQKKDGQDVHIRTLCRETQRHLRGIGQDMSDTGTHRVLPLRSLPGTPTVEVRDDLGLFGLL
ncbi:TBP [Mytilus edulis]|uniref:TBP n=1 Tax=Mytilus edulis TaxID=6550 RepID=A0A8S3SRD0_MYTED|nr:TBP [Mytilus edulis]